MGLRAGDIVLTRSDSPGGSIIRWFTQSKGETATKVNHVGIMVDGFNIVEALAHVLHRPIDVGYTGKPIAIYRPLNLTDAEREAITVKAMSYVGRTYGYVKIVAHAIDRFFGGVYVARRLACVDRYPICSWLVAQAYKVAGKDFGVAAGQADPDDIWDFVVARQDKYVRVFPPPESADALGKWPGTTN